MNRRDFGGRLRAARRARGVSQEKLGEALGLSHTAISRWEANGSRPSFENLEGLNRFLQVSIDALMFGDAAQVRETPGAYKADALDTDLVAAVLALPDRKKRALLELLRSAEKQP